MLIGLIFLFVLLPTVELALLIAVGRALGLGGALALILLTGVFGATLARAEGVRAFAQVRASLARGQLPTAEIVEAVLVLVAGLVLITPGLITDAAGFMLLIGPVRRVVRKCLIDYFRSHVRIIAVDSQARPRPGAGAGQARGDAIDVKAEVLDD